MTTNQKVIRAKAGLLELAKQLGNVSQACKSGSRRRSQTGAAADDHDGLGADLPAAADDGAAFRAPDLPVSAARSRSRSAEPGLVCGYHLHSDASRLPLSGRGDGLVDAAGAELAFVRTPWMLSSASPRWRRHWRGSGGRTSSTATDPEPSLAEPPDCPAEGDHVSLRLSTPTPSSILRRVRKTRDALHSQNATRGLR